MNVKQLFISLILACSFPLSAATIYVSPSGTATNSGQSWSSPTTLVSALASALPGDQVWVTAGDYSPGEMRTSSFIIKAGVQVYGGFSGKETELDQRELDTSSATTLTGNIGDAASSDDNVYTVVTMLKADGQTVLDGFTITGGAANAFDRNLNLTTTAGALYISGSEDAYGPVISNCNFTDNHARFGGAVFIDAKTNDSQPFFKNCQFTNNKADARGGAIFNEATDGLASPIFNECTFQLNKADIGACLFNQGTRGKCTPRLMNCEFTKNQALTDGAVIYNMIDGTAGEAKEIMTTCHMADNDSYLGNDIISNYQVSNKQEGRSSTQTGGTLRAVN